MFEQHEPAEFEIAPELAAVERQLARLTPAAPRVDRDKLMFEAGRAAARPKRPGYIAEPFRLGGRFWPAAAVLMTAASLLLGTMLVWQRHDLQIAMQQSGPTIVATPVADAPQNVATPHTPRPEITSADWSTLGPPRNDYLGVRYAVLTQGVGALDQRFSTTGGDRDSSNELQRTQREMLNELLPSTSVDHNTRS